VVGRNLMSRWRSRRRRNTAAVGLTVLAGRRRRNAASGGGFPGPRLVAVTIAAALVVGMAGVLAVVTTAPRPATAAPTAASCSFATAGSGTFARTLCWFDLSAYNATTAGSAAGQSMTVALPGGYTISFTLKVTGGAAAPFAFPTFSGAYLGNKAYTGVAGKPALYQTGSGTTTTAALSAISVVDSNGKPVTGYSFVGADAEATDAGESITWTSDQPLNSISPIGNACNSGAGLTGVGTTTVKCSSTVSSTKTGTAILAAEHPSTLTQTMVGAGKQAVAFGVLVSTVQLTKSVASRINPTDAFGVSVSSSTGSVLGSANTGTANNAATGQLTVLTGAAGEDYTLAESATSGLLSDYAQSWSCTRNGAADPALPSGSAGPSATVTLGIGDFVNCTITNAALPVSLSLVKQAGNPNDVNQDGITDAGDTIPYAFVVTNTGALPMSNITVTDSKVGAVTCPQPTLAPGASETCTAVKLYTVTAADVRAGAVNNTATASGVPPGGTSSVKSAPSSTSTPTQAPNPAVSVAKTANASGGATNPLTVGETITYSYLVINTGNDNLTAVSVSDPTIGTVTCPTPPPPGLAPGDSETCTANAPHTVTQTDVDNGKVVDTATATGTDPNGITSPISAPSTATVGNEAAAPAVAINKNAQVVPSADQGAANVGDTVIYSYVVTNTGNVTLASVAVSDPTQGPVTCPTPPAPGLAPGASETCTANAPHTVTQADVDRGSITDSATATGTDTRGNVSPASDPSTVTIPAVAAAPAVSIAKTGTVSPVADQAAAKFGDTITYAYVVTNTGNITLTSVAVNDPTIGPVTCPSPPAPGLAPGASETCTANSVYTVNQADVDNGSVVDTATATAIDTQGDTTQPSDPSTVTIPTEAAAPAVNIAKTGTVSPVTDQGAVKAGDTITYTYLVTNTGNVTLPSVAVNDPTQGPVTCPTPPSPGLDPGAALSCTAASVYTVTQVDVDNGSVVDTATATGTDTKGNVSPVSDPSTATIPTVAAAPAVSLVKTATVSPPADQSAVRVGDAITYTYLVTNTGNVDLPSVAVNDPTAGSVSCPSPPAPGLAPGSSETCTATSVHVVTQADVDNGSVSDTATATGTDTQGGTSQPSTPSTVVIPAVSPAPAVSLAKIGLASGGDSNPLFVGETIAYSYLVTNTGNVTLASVAVDDPTRGPVTCPAPAAPGLAPGASETCTANSVYTVTQADVDRGSVSDTATATGLDTHDHVSPPSDPSTFVVSGTPMPSVVIHKTAQVTPDADQDAAKVGDTVSYGYLVTNTGNVTLVSVAVSDPTAGSVTCPTPPAPGLAPGSSETCTADTPHTVTQADVDNGSVVDTATATGIDAQNDTSPPSDPSTATVITVAPAPADNLTKQGRVNPGADQNAAKAGDTISYSYVVTNTGNVTLASVAVDDPTLGGVTCPTPAAPGLAPGASETCTADSAYTVTQADVDNGSVTDTATATGTDTRGNVSPASNPPATATIDTEAPAPAVSLAKQGAVDPASDQAAAKVGDTISYTYVVTNTGNVTLASVAVDDPSLGTVTCPIPADPGLAPGASETCTGDSRHTVTQADVDNGSVTDTATATGTDTQGNVSPASNPAPATIDTVTAAPAVSLIKTANASSGDNAPLSQGETISYLYLVTNTGNVTLASVAVDDPFIIIGGVTCPTLSAPGLAPGASVTCAADTPHTVTQADVDNGSVTDKATATGTDTKNQTSPSSDPSTVVVPSNPAPKVVVHKEARVKPAAHQSSAQVGDSIAYTYQVTNVGNVTLASVAVSDPTQGPVTCPTPPAPGLAPGASETCTANAPHTVTQKDVDAGRVTDTATATGAYGQGHTPISPPSTATVFTVAAKPDVSLRKLAIVKPAADQNAAKKGDTISFSFVVTNIGNVTLTSVAVSDPDGGPVFCPVPAAPGLALGASETCTGDSHYTVTQADVANGKVIDTTSATGTDTRGTAGPPSDPSTVVVLTATTTAPTAAAAAAASPAPAAQTTATPNGLGQIATDLGRWTGTSGPAAWLVWTGIGLGAGGGVAFGIRRRRQRHQSRSHPGGDEESGRAG
jgi:uncharacterized repeat protein (TIGR01451 family)